MLDKLSSVLKKTTDKIANAIFLDKNLVDQIIRDLQRALIEADVNVSLVLEITKKIKRAALDERIKGVEKKEHVVKLLHDELVGLLGEKREIKLEKNNVWMMLGLYCQGKTTTISKLASYYSKRGSKVCAIGLDVHRPAASEQLKQLCDKLNIPAFISPEEKDAKKIWRKFEPELKKYSLVLIDTAGRAALSSDLIKEVKAPVVFIGTGEKPADLETFDPESFLSRLLGMGDLKSLMEKVQNVIDKDKIEETQKRLQEGKFTLKDLQQQLESMESLGSMDKIIGMIPGLGKAKIPDEAMAMQQKKAKNWKHAISSMTKEEIENPEVIEKQTSRLQRIAKGSGTTTSDIRALIKQYKMLKEMIKSQASLSGETLNQKTMMKFAKKFAKKVRF